MVYVKQKQSSWGTLLRRILLSIGAWEFLIQWDINDSLRKWELIGGSAAGS